MISSTCMPTANNCSNVSYTVHKIVNHLHPIATCTLCYAWPHIWCQKVSVYLSVCPPVCHNPVLYQNSLVYRRLRCDQLIMWKTLAINCDHSAAPSNIFFCGHLTDSCIKHWSPSVCPSYMATQDRTRSQIFPSAVSMVFCCSKCSQIMQVI